MMVIRNTVVLLIQKNTRKRNIKTANFVVLILRACVFFEPLKVFLPVAGALAAVGVAWGVAQLTATGGLGEAPVLFLLAGLQTLLVGLIADMISRRN